MYSPSSGWGRKQEGLVGRLRSTRSRVHSRRAAPAPTMRSRDGFRRHQERCAATGSGTARAAEEQARTPDAGAGLCRWEFAAGAREVPRCVATVSTPERGRGQGRRGDEPSRTRTAGEKPKPYGVGRRAGGPPPNRERSTGPRPRRYWRPRRCSRGCMRLSFRTP
jgi:hypothetical protein